ncbi:DUF4350 domain-containing protein [Calidifontibacter terrae]
MRRRLTWVATLIVLVLIAAAATLLLDRRSDTPLDPANPGRDGAEAVATVLAEHGVRVRAVQKPAGLAAARPGADAAILVPRPQELSNAALRSLLRANVGAARVVLISPRTQQLDGVLPELTGSNVAAWSDCSLPWGHDLTFPESTRWYQNLPTDAKSCFGNGSQVPAFELPPTADHPAVLVLGSAEPLRNGSISDGDNAAIALRALGQTSELLWYSGGFDPATTQESVAPRWIRPALWLVGATVLLLMLWRGRRLGKLVSEPLPVVVRANETTRARGQLYRKARDTPAMARTLRAGTRGRLTTTLGLAPRTPPERLVDEVARATGRRPEEVARLLLDNGTDPGARALPEFARELTALERQARRS